MGWKDWPYWLRGGIKFLLIGITLLIGAWASGGGGGFMPPNWVLAVLPGFWIVNQMEVFDFARDNKLLASFLTIAIALVIYFILGIICGWIYGKIKNRKKKQGQSFQS